MVGNIHLLTHKFAFLTFYSIYIYILSRMEIPQKKSVGNTTLYECNLNYEPRMLVSQGDTVSVVFHCLYSSSAREYKHKKSVRKGCNTEFV